MGHIYHIEHVYEGASKPIVIPVGEAKTVPHAKRVFSSACANHPKHPDLRSTTLRESKFILARQDYKVDAGKDTV